MNSTANKSTCYKCETVRHTTSDHDAAMETAQKLVETQPEYPLLKSIEWRRPYRDDVARGVVWYAVITTIGRWPHGANGIGVCLYQCSSGWQAQHGTGLQSAPFPTRETAIKAHIPVMFEQVKKSEQERKEKEERDEIERRKKHAEKQRKSILGESGIDLLQAYRNLSRSVRALSLADAYARSHFSRQDKPPREWEGVSEALVAGDKFIQQIDSKLAEVKE
jgi:hypothetical protein